MSSNLIYCFYVLLGPVSSTKADPGTVEAYTKDGVLLARHSCSSECFARHDIGLNESTWQHKHYNAAYGLDNWELVWVGTATRDFMNIWIREKQNENN